MMRYERADCGPLIAECFTSMDFPSARSGAKHLFSPMAGHTQAAIPCGMMEWQLQPHPGRDHSAPDCHGAG